MGPDEALYNWIRETIPDEDASEEATFSADAGEFAGAILSYLDAYLVVGAIPKSVLDRVYREWPVGENRRSPEVIAPR